MSFNVRTPHCCKSCREKNPSASEQFQTLLYDKIEAQTKHSVLNYVHFMLYSLSVTTGERSVGGEAAQLKISL